MITANQARNLLDIDSSIQHHLSFIEDDIKYQTKLGKRKALAMIENSELMKRVRDILIDNGFQCVVEGKLINISW